MESATKSFDDYIEEIEEILNNKIDLSQFLKIVKIEWLTACYRRFFLRLFFTSLFLLLFLSLYSKPANEFLTSNIVNSTYA